MIFCAGFVCCHSTFNNKYIRNTTEKYGNKTLTSESINFIDDSILQSHTDHTQNLPFICNKGYWRLNFPCSQVTQLEK